MSHAVCGGLWVVWERGRAELSYAGALALPGNAIGLGALRRGTLAKAFVAAGSLSLIFPPAAPMSAALRVQQPASELPAFQVPLISFPGISVPKLRPVPRIAGTADASVRTVA